MSRATPRAPWLRATAPIANLDVFTIFFTKEHTMRLFKTDLIFMHPPQRKPYSLVRQRRRYGSLRRVTADVPCLLPACARCASSPVAAIDFSSAIVARAA
jgi:hypothetical protein